MSSLMVHPQVSKESSSRIVEEENHEGSEENVDDEGEGSEIPNPRGGTND